MAILPTRDDLTAPLPTPAIPITVPITSKKQSSSLQMALNSPVPRALLFDVFGTCVDWRTTVVGELEAESHVSLNAATASLASALRIRVGELTMEHWGMFASQWRESYQKFTRRLAEDPTIPWKSVDDHHLESLRELVTKWQIEGLWDDEQLRKLSLVWHRLQAWPDSVSGVALLNQLFSTCTLSNGNLSLLSDLRAHSGIPFTYVFSAELFGTYKPAAGVYLGAAEKLKLPPKECAMVAAHLNDLKAAKANGLQTIYVERVGEEEWSDAEVEKAKSWVDLWVGLDGNQGFITVAEKMGIARPSHERKLSSSAPTPTGV